MPNNENFLEIENINDLSEEFNIRTGLIINNVIERLRNNDYDGIKIVGSINNFIMNHNLGYLNSFFVELIKSGNIKIIFDIEINGKYENLSNFSNCIFNKNIEFENSTLKEDIIFENCTFEGNLKFENCNIDGKLEIKDCNKGNIILNKIKDLKSLNISGGEFDIIKLSHIYMDKENGVFLCDGLNVNEFILEKSTKFFENVSITNININNILKLIHINLGKTIFNGVKIKKLYLENATLNDCIFNGVEFPKNYELEEKYKYYNEKKKKEIWSKELSNKQLKDNYRQLKFVMDKNGNYTEGNSFFSKEMSYYFQDISWINPKKYLLLIQGLLSYFGNCWFLTIVRIFLIGLFFTNSLDIFTENFWNLFFTNINPFDKSLLTDKSIDWKQFLHKIILIILYWHLVVALKRTTKR